MDSARHRHITIPYSAIGRGRPVGPVGLGRSYVKRETKPGMSMMNLKKDAKENPSNPVFSASLGTTPFPAMGEAREGLEEITSKTSCKKKKTHPTCQNVIDILKRHQPGSTNVI